MQLFLEYCYRDSLDARLDAESAAAVLHVGQYYGAPRLVGLAERLLAREIKRREPEDEGAQQHRLLWLPHLGRACALLLYSAPVRLCHRLQTCLLW